MSGLRTCSFSSFFSFVFLACLCRVCEYINPHLYSSAILRPSRIWAAARGQTLYFRLWKRHYISTLCLTRFINLRRVAKRPRPRLVDIDLTRVNAAFGALGGSMNARHPMVTTTSTSSMTMRKQQQHAAQQPARARAQGTGHQTRYSKRDSGWASVSAYVEELGV